MEEEEDKTSHLSSCHITVTISASLHRASISFSSLFWKKKSFNKLIYEFLLKHSVLKVTNDNVIFLAGQEINSGYVSYFSIKKLILEHWYSFCKEQWYVHSHEIQLITIYHIWLILHFRMLCKVLLTTF